MFALPDQITNFRFSICRSWPNP